MLSEILLDCDLFAVLFTEDCLEALSMPRPSPPARLVSAGDLKFKEHMKPVPQSLTATR
jgi:hypothetical protein